MIATIDAKIMAKMGIKEYFLTIDDYPNYQVSNYGNVRNAITLKNLSLCVNGNGYQQISLKKKNKTVHRLVMETFAFNIYNKRFIDHIDGNKTNNCIFNLRYATQQENNFNQKLRCDNTSGYKGVLWHKKREKWVAQIYLKTKLIHIGYYNDKEDAIEARRRKARELFGCFIHSSEM